MSLVVADQRFVRDRFYKAASSLADNTCFVGIGFEGKILFCLARCLYFSVVINFHRGMHTEGIDISKETHGCCIVAAFMVVETRTDHFPKGWFETTIYGL